MPDRKDYIEFLSKIVKTGKKYKEFNDDTPIRISLKSVKDILILLKEHETKSGHWIDSAGDCKCSVCGATYSDLYPDYQNTHYCPNCGAKMIGPEVK